MRRRGADARLRAGEGSGGDAAALEAEGEERGRECLAGRQRAICLAGEARVRIVGGLAKGLPAVGQQHPRRSEDRIGDALEGAHDHDRVET